jgi:hypothetical protein
MKTAISGEMKGSKLAALPLVHTTWRDWRSRFPETDVLSTQTGHRRNYSKNPYAGYERQSRLYFPVSNEDRSYPRKTLVVGVEVAGQYKAYPFDELKKSPTSFTDNVGDMILYWFAWSAFHPDTQIYTAE